MIHCLVIRLGIWCIVTKITRYFEIILTKKVKVEFKKEYGFIFLVLFFFFNGVGKGNRYIFILRAKCVYILTVVCFEYLYTVNKRWLNDYCMYWIYLNFNPIDDILAFVRFIYRYLCVFISIRELKK